MTRILGTGMSDEALARDTEQSDREYIAQRQARQRVPRFKAIGWWKFHDGRDVASVILDRDCSRSALLDIFRRVMIDGCEYDVQGVESFAIESQRKGMGIGLLVGTRQPNKQPSRS